MLLNVPSPAGTIRYPPGEALRWAERRFGSVVRYRTGRQRYAYLLGPDANRFVFANDGLFTMREAMASLIPVDGPTSLVVSDGHDHRRRRRLVQPSMHRTQVEGYVATMVRQADAELSTWRSGRPVDAYRSLRAAIRRSTIEALFGAELARDEPAIAADLQPLLDLISLLPDTVRAHQRLRTRTWRRAMAARERLDARIHAEIARSRAAPPDEQNHVLATLVYGRDGEGGGLSDLEVRDQVVTLIAAGHETTSAAAAWLVHALATVPGVREHARAELEAVLASRADEANTADTAPTAADLARLPYLQAVVSEVLRLYPPAVVSARHVATGFEFAGRTVRPGTIVLYSPYVTHRSADVYANPDRFRPQRWLGENGKHRSMAPYEFLPFGGGAHRCIGSAMAVAQLRVLLARLLMLPAYEVVPQRIRPAGVAAMRPRDGMLVRPG